MLFTVQLSACTNLSSDASFESQIPNLASTHKLLLDRKEVDVLNGADTKEQQKKILVNNVLL
jgi:hypothetical protein